MPYMRYQTDLAIPEVAYNNIPLAKKREIDTAIKYLKDRSVIINKGKPNEEDTTKAIKYVCRHDVEKPCGPKQEI